REVLRPFRQLLPLALAVAVLAGCQRGPTKTDLSTEEKHILRIASLYSEFRSAHQGRSPRDAKELKEWAKTLPKDALTSRGIENLDDAFVSPRDNEPYVLIKPEATRLKRGGPPAMVWVYEKTGLEGKRMAVGGMGAAFEMDEEQFKSFVTAAR